MVFRRAAAQPGTLLGSSGGAGDPKYTGGPKRGQREMANHSRIVGNGRVVSAAPPAASGPGESSAEESAQAVPPGAAGGGPVEHQPAGSRDSDQALDQGAKRRNIGGGGALKALEKRAKATASKEPYGNPS